MDLQWLESGEMPPEDLDSLSRNLAFHLKHLVDERDTQLEVMTVYFYIDSLRRVGKSFLSRRQHQPNNNKQG